MGSRNSTSLLDFGCCATCKADVEISRSTIRGPPDTLYKDLKRSNRYPDGASPYKEEHKAAKVRLDQLRATIALLEAEKKRLEGIVEKYKVILHPIRIAPADVLRQIFDFCVDRIEGQVDLPPSSLTPSRMPWVLGQICRSWRDLVLYTPQLWNTISLEIRQIEGLSRESISADVQRLGLQLHRSQDLPLIVSIFSDNVKLQGNGSLRITSETLLDIHPFLVLVCSFSERWKYLHLKGSSQGVQRVFSTRGFLPRLEWLVMDLDETPDQATACFEFAPQLTSISLHTVTLIKLPWNQIQRFRFNRRSIPSRPSSSFAPVSDTDSSRFYDIIRHLKNVQICDLFFDRGFSVSDMKAAMQTPGKSGKPKIVMGYLTALMFSGDLSTESTGHAVIPHFLEGISTPRLSHLQIASPFVGWDELLIFIRQSQCRLTTLTIPQSQSLSPKILNDVLSSLPDLKTLEIGIVGGAGNDHISTFTSPVVPNLEKLTIVRSSGTGSWYWYRSYDDSVMIDMLAHRRNRDAEDTSGASRLCFVSLDRRITDQSSRKRLDALVSQGMVVIERSG
ncbi:hypothetical protein VNI00_006796 [Paramarasmius palmivorus]|uniref:F-box domain-containing protein n=1 Tax=Paramarasmius palmivorus TaxID=297713 RepID=A0AAW0D4P9_9AGAR